MIVMIILVLGALFFAWQGSSMHRDVAIQEAAFHELQREYFLQSKVVRDAAETGSALNEQLVQIANYPSELLTLKLVGVGTILLGIFFLLLGILIALMIMPVRLKALMER